LVNDNHTNPYENCCIAKINGMPAKGRCRRVAAFFIAATPAIESTDPEKKLVVAEKHIFPP